MKIIISIWFLLFIINLFLMVVNIFSRDENAIKFSFWTKLFPLQFLLVIAIIFIAKVIDGNDFSELFPHGILLLLFSFYAVYSVFMFGYSFFDEKFTWYNGIIRRKINAKSIEEIHLYQKDQVIQKFVFSLAGKMIKLRNDAGIETIILNFANTNQIPIVEKYT